MAETVIYDPSNQGMNNALPWMLANNNGWGNGLGGFGGGIVGFLLGLAFGNGWGGFGGFGGGMNGAGAGFLSNQINNDAGRELLMNAINSNGEASRTAVQSLATMLGQDFNLVNAGVQTIQTALSNLALQQAVSVPQIINAIQSGDASLASQLCQCCCENKLLITSQGYENQIATLNQTNALAGAITGASQRNVDAIADLKTSMIDQFCQAKERDMQAKIDTQAEIITQLRSAADNANQTRIFSDAFNVLNQKITDLAAKQPNTVPVQWPALTAVNTTPYVNGGYYTGGSGFFPGFGYGNGINF